MAELRQCVSPRELLAYAVLGIVGGLVAVLFAKAIGALRPRLRALPQWTQYFLPASASDHRTAGYMTAEQTNALMQGISDASVQAILGAGGNPNNVAWSASPGVGVATSGSQPFPGPTKIPAGVLGEAGAWYPIYKFTHPADGRQMGLYVHSIGTIDSPAIQLVYRYDPGLLEAFWNGIKELIAAIIEIAGDTATGTWYLLQTCTYVKGNQAVWGAATYHDRYVRESGGWKFQHVRVESHFWTSFEEGWARMRFMQRRNAKG
jgi:hypothetical protein